MADSFDQEAPGQTGGISKVGSFRPDKLKDSDHETRRWISYWLLLLLTGLLIISFVALFEINGNGTVVRVGNGTISDAVEDSDRLLQLINIVFGPVVTLVSSVVGFYFGARTAQDSGSGT